MLKQLHRPPLGSQPWSWSTSCPPSSWVKVGMLGMQKRLKYLGYSRIKHQTPVQPISVVTVSWKTHETSFHREKKKTVKEGTLEHSHRKPNWEEFICLECYRLALRIAKWENPILSNAKSTGHCKFEGILYGLMWEWVLGWRSLMLPYFTHLTTRVPFLPNIPFNSITFYLCLYYAQTNGMSC